MTSASSDATLAAAPPYVVVGEPWPDPEWMEAAAKSAGARSEAEKVLFMGGPRPHPWGFVAYHGSLPDGRWAYFPSKAAYDAHMSGATQQAGQPALAALNYGLSQAAHAASAAEGSEHPPG